MEEFIIKKNDANQRLDKFLRKYLKNLPLSVIYKLIRTKKIKINDTSVTADTFIRIGNKITIFEDISNIKRKISSKLNFCNKSLNIVYEDENLLIVYKDSGVLVHEDVHEKDDTLIKHIWYYLQNKGEIDTIAKTFMPTLCHRLDRNTEGLIMCAKNSLTLKVMNEKIKNREIEKFYLCLVEGYVKNTKGIIETYLYKDENTRTVSVCNGTKIGSQKAITEYKVLNRGEISLLEIKLITGRMHQIRVHLANIGHPIIGDLKYNYKKYSGVKTQRLSAYKIVFRFKNSTHLDYLENKEINSRNLVSFVKKYYLVLVLLLIGHII